VIRNRSNQAPKTTTILVAAVLTIFAALVFFTSLVPATVLGFAAATLALWAAIVAFVLMLLGVFLKGL
jgi:hypothetical protein